MTASERLKKIRIEEKLSQNEFAERLNVSRSTLMLIEQGKREINTKILEVLKSEFSISADWVLFGEKSDNTDDLKSLLDDFNKSKELNTILQIYIGSWVNLVVYHLVKNEYYECADLIQIKIKESDKMITMLDRITNSINSDIADYTINPSVDLAECIKSNIKKYFKDMFEFIDFTKGLANISPPVIDIDYDWTGELAFEVGDNFEEIRREIEEKTKELLKNK